MAVQVKRLGVFLLSTSRKFVEALSHGELCNAPEPACPLVTRRRGYLRERVECCLGLNRLFGVWGDRDHLLEELLSGLHIALV